MKKAFLLLISCGIASSQATTGFTRMFHFANGSDSIAFLGGSQNGVCPISGPFTVEAVIRPFGMTGGIWQQWKGPVMQQSLSLGLNGSDPGLFCAIAAPDFPDWRFLGRDAVPVGKWTHLAWVYDGFQVRLYQNGVLELSEPVPSGFIHLASGEACSLGFNTNSQKASVTMDVADFRVSNVARYTGSPFTPPTRPFALDDSTMLLIDPSSFSSTPTVWRAPGTQGITAILGGIPDGTLPAWVPYTP